MFRLYRTLVPEARFALPEALRDDLAAFLDTLPVDSPDWSSIHDAVKELPEPKRVLTQIRENFGVGGG